ncbi:hypothetical protein ABKN59_006315 [Abortiporus biennis]
MSTYTDSEDDHNDRPNKKRRIVEYSHPTPRQIVLEELDLEIALRERLLSTVQSRLTWALVLQQQTVSALNTSGENESVFRDAALDALTAIERPCDPLFTRDIRPPKPRLPVPTKIHSNPSYSIPNGRATTMTTRTRGAPRPVRPPPKKLLFLRNNTTDPPQVVKLACADCSRTDFSSLQGLLNHCRLRHQRDYGSHDECVQSCAILVEKEEEQVWVIANGIEVAGISLPGLRRLFEIAVGGGQSVLPLPLPSARKEVTPKVEETTPSTPSTKDEVPTDFTEAPTTNTNSSSTLLTRTLGLHEDSPALAHFLGKEPKKRCITAHHENEVVDIFAGVTKPARKSKRDSWRMTFAQRSKAASFVDDVHIQDLTLDEGLKAVSNDHDIRQEHASGTVTPNAIQGSGSRFHIIARVTVEDRSVYIPPSKRHETKQNITHKWRLTIGSPSYSIPLNNILEKVTITCLTDPPPSCLVNPLTLEGPPFVVTSTTDRPFLASLTFSWAGNTRLNPPTTIEHWVELDPLHLSTPVAGDEQVFDVELDRNTEFLPIRPDAREVNWDVDDNTEVPIPTSSGAQETQEDGSKVSRKNEEVSDCTLHLKALLHHVPMTAKDLKGRTFTQRQLPYLLVSSPAHFRNLVHGRRKAIEWGRARALRDAYDQSQVTEEKISLSIADVYRWLEEHGQFLRDPNEKTHVKQEQPISEKTELKSSAPSLDAEGYCRYCGLHYQLHPNSTESFIPARCHGTKVKEEPIPAVIPIPTKPAVDAPCLVFNGNSIQLPSLDVKKILLLSQETRPSSEDQANQKSSMSPLISQHSMLTDANKNALLAVTDPKLTISIREILARSQPYCGGKFQIDRSEVVVMMDQENVNNDKSREMTLARLDKSKKEVEDELVPFALLGLLTKSMAKLLIQGGMDASRRDETSFRALATGRPKGGRAIFKEGPRRLLTPSHVVRGLLWGESSAAGISEE